jgi:chromosome segregation ATPase
VELLERQIAELNRKIDGMVGHDELRAFIEHAKTELKELKSGVGEVNGHIADLMLEVGDAPDHKFRQPGRPNLRERVHQLESNEAAAKIAATAASAALEAVKESKRQQWTTWQKAALFVIALVGMVLGILAAIGITH